MSERELKFEFTTSVNSRGRTTIPQALRLTMGIEDGDNVKWIAEDGIVKFKREEDEGGGE